MSMTDKVNEMDVISKIKEINQTNQINEIDEIISCLCTNVPIFYCQISRPDTSACAMSKVAKLLSILVVGPFPVFKREGWFMGKTSFPDLRQ
jgi:hypothetical protein